MQPTWRSRPGDPEQRGPGGAWQHGQLAHAARLPQPPLPRPRGRRRRRPGPAAEQHHAFRHVHPAAVRPPGRRACELQHALVHTWRSVGCRRKQPPPGLSEEVQARHAHGALGHTCRGGCRARRGAGARGGRRPPVPRNDWHQVRLAPAPAVLTRQRRHAARHRVVSCGGDAVVNFDAEDEGGTTKHEDADKSCNLRVDNLLICAGVRRTEFRIG